MRTASVKDIAATGNCGANILGAADIASDEFHVFWKKCFLLEVPDEHSHQVPPIAQLMYKMLAEKSGRSSYERFLSFSSIRMVNVFQCGNHF